MERVEPGMGDQEVVSCFQTPAVFHGTFSLDNVWNLDTGGPGQRKSPNRDCLGNVSGGPLVSSGSCDGDPAFDTPSPFEVEGWKPGSLGMQPEGLDLSRVLVTWPPREQRLELHWPLPSNRQKAELVVKT